VRLIFELSMINRPIIEQYSTGKESTPRSMINRPMVEQYNTGKESKPRIIDRLPVFYIVLPHANNHFHYSCRYIVPGTKTSFPAVSPCFLPSLQYNHTTCLLVCFNNI